MVRRLFIFLGAGSVMLAVVVSVLYGVHSTCGCLQEENVPPESYDYKVAHNTLVFGAIAIASFACCYFAFLLCVLPARHMALPFAIFALLLLLQYLSVLVSSTLCACGSGEFASSPPSFIDFTPASNFSTTASVVPYRAAVAGLFGALGLGAVVQLICAPTGYLLGIVWDVTIASTYPLTCTSALLLFLFTPAIAAIEQPALAVVPLALVMLTTLLGQYRSHSSPRPLQDWEYVEFCAPAQRHHSGGGDPAAAAAEAERLRRNNARRHTAAASAADVNATLRNDGDAEEDAEIAAAAAAGVKHTETLADLMLGRQASDPVDDAAMSSGVAAAAAAATTAAVAVEFDDIPATYPSQDKKLIRPLIQPLNCPTLGDIAARHCASIAAAADEKKACIVGATVDPVFAEVLSRVQRISVPAGRGSTSHEALQAHRAAMPSLASQHHDQQDSDKSAASETPTTSSPASVAAADTLTVVQITDPHVGSVMSVDRLARICQAVVLLRPDLVFITGDLFTVETTRMGADILCAALAPLRQLPKGTVYACQGNHDVGETQIVYDQFKHGIESCGGTLLEDSGVLVRTRVGLAEIIGLRFYHVARPHIERYFAVERAQELAARRMHFRACVARFVLLHDPGAFVHLPPGLGAVVFSGHIHGGQLAIPVVGASRHWTIGRAVGLFDNGLWHAPARQTTTNLLYVHRGQGHRSLMSNAVPRLWVNPEDSVLRIRVVK